MNLTQSDYKEIEQKIKDIKKKHISDIGDRDVQYIRGLYDEWTSQISNGEQQMFSAKNPIEFIKGVKLYGLGRRKEFLEAHNIYHNQYTRLSKELPEFQPDVFKWVSSCDVETWKSEHNGIHHIYTNDTTKDLALSYGFLRTHSSMRWHPFHLIQVPLYHLFYFKFTHMFNSYNLGRYDVIRKFLLFKESDYPKHDTNKTPKEAAELDKKLFREFVREKYINTFKKYNYSLKIILGLILGEAYMNFCVAFTILSSHVPEEKFNDQLTPKSLGEWYVRQIITTRNYYLGSVERLKLYNGLNYQIEHHLFPSLPSWRYVEISKDVKKICQEYGIPYNEDKTIVQTYLKYLKVIAKYSFPFVK